MTWVEAARGPFERLLEAEAESGADAARRRLEGLRQAYLDLRAGGMDRPLGEAPDTARTKGAWVLWMLRLVLTPPRFQALRNAWRQGGALETAGLRELAERQSGQDLERFFDFWVYGVGLPEYRLRGASGRSEGGTQTVILQVENLGTGACPVPLVVQSEEGARHELAATVPAGAREELRFTLVTRPVQAAVDPETTVLMACAERPWVPVRVRRKFWIF